MMNTVGTTLARQRERFIATHGSSVSLSNGTVLKALIHHGQHELMRSVRDEGESPEKRPVVLVFGGSAWGIILENMPLTIGGNVTLPKEEGVTPVVAMQRVYRVSAPLHPKFRQDVVTELAVVAYPD